MNWFKKRFSKPPADLRSVDRGDDEGRAENGAPSSKGKISSDDPIATSEEDALGRTSIARSFAEHVLSLDAAKGVVVGVLGPWGSGKTSFVNLARPALEEAGVAILDFNPWMFSGAEQLVDSFFIEVSSQLKLRPELGALAKDLEEYGELFSGLVWIPVVGPWVERGRNITKGLAKILQRRKEGIGGRRAKVQKALAALKTPLVVVVDDIDRLSSSEIRDIFKLVRLTASFPNVIYVLCFDRLRVEIALTEAGLSGRDYIEKILQVTIDIPIAPRQIVVGEIPKAIDAVLSKIDNAGPFHQGDWPDVFAEVILPLMRNMRDVRRYASAIYGTVRALDGQVALVDVLALEAIRIFMPDVFTQLSKSVEGLTTPPGDYERRDSSRPKAQIDNLLAKAGDQVDVVRALINRIFPPAQRHIGGSHFGSEWAKKWLKDRRMAHPDILQLYLERFAAQGLLAFTDAERAWMRMSDPQAFEVYLRSVDPGRLQDVIASLEAYQDEFGLEHAISGTVVLLNVLPDIPARPSGMFSFGPEMSVGRVVLRVLRALNDTVTIEAVVREALPQISTLSSKLELIDTVGHRDNVGHKLVSEGAAARFEKDWREVVRQTKPGILCKEKDILRIVALVGEESSPNEPVYELTRLPEMTLALLHSAFGQATSQAMGSRAVRRHPRLHWDALIKIYGDEAVLRGRIEELKTLLPTAGSEDVVALAEKYLTGWRPDRFS